MNWTEYLPPSLQLSTAYFIIACCWSVGYFCRLLPTKAQTTIVMQYAILCTGLEAGILLRPGGSIVYGLGTGLICATISMIAYDLIFAQIEIKIRALLGTTSTSATPNSVTPSAVRAIDLQNK